MAQGKTYQRCAFEALEIRQLLATINVTDFGARPNDGGDDSGAIKAAMNASHPGDTIRFGSGTFDLPAGLTINPDRTYDGAGATIRGKNAEGWLIRSQYDNTTIQNFTFNGGGLFVERFGTTGRPKNIVIDHNTFNLNTSGNLGGGITFTCGLVNSRITNNYISGNAPYAIYGYNYDGLTIQNNVVAGTQTGFHIDAFGNSQNLLVQSNLITGTRGMGMEFQGTASGLRFFDNVYTQPNLSSDRNQNRNAIAFSFVLDKSNDIQVKRNAVISNAKPDGLGCPLGFELGGDNVLVEDNYVNGPDVAAYDSDGNGTTSMTVRNNRWVNVNRGDYLAFPGPGRTYSSSNNGSGTVLTWDVNRAWPSIGQGSSDTPAPADTSQPTSAPPSSGSAKYLSDMAWISARNGWGAAERDHSNGETGSNDGRTITLNGTTYAKGLGVHASSEIHVALNGSYKQFASDIGVDDEEGATGSVTFEVWADGQKLYSSGVMTGNSATKSVNVDVSGKKELVLIVNGGDNINNDHADWAGARLTPA